MTTLNQTINESVMLIKLRMKFMTTEEEINSAVKTINQLRRLIKS